tara:strand:+ start:304 stop:555 length:252 start_codon:yes stop_codon:yes gene_type:complete
MLLGLVLNTQTRVFITIYPKQIGKSAIPFQINNDSVHAIKISNKIEFDELDLKVIKGTFGKCIGLNINNPKIQTRTKPILESP